MEFLCFMCDSDPDDFYCDSCEAKGIAEAEAIIVANRFNKRGDEDSDLCPECYAALPAEEKQAYQEFDIDSNPVGNEVASD